MVPVYLIWRDPPRAPQQRCLAPSIVLPDLPEVAGRSGERDLEVKPTTRRALPRVDLRVPAKVLSQPVGATKRKVVMHDGDAGAGGQAFVADGASAPELEIPCRKA